MNPMLRWASAIHEVKNSQIEDRMQRKRDAQKVKLRQEKEMRRLDAIERDNKRRSEQKPVTMEKEGEEAKSEESAAGKFQKELSWCIQQLEVGLASMKPNAQQAVEAERLLKILRSSKAPMARKRQIMRASFGNYRAKMQQEEKKHSEAMERSKSLTPVETDQLNTATFFRRATSTSSQPIAPRNVNIQSLIPETVAEETEDDTREDEIEKGDGEAEEEDILMKSLESETMGMHLCKSDEANRDNFVEISNEDGANVAENGQSADDADNILNVSRGMNNEAREEEEEEKENIPIRTLSDTDDTAHSQMSSNFSSTASLFSFNFEIAEQDMDTRRASHSVAMKTSNQKSEAVETFLMRGIDNRASDSTSSSGGTPTKKSGRKRSRGKRKQPGNQENDSKRSPKDALVTQSPKIEMAAKEGFKFEFPDPVESSET